MDEDNIPLARLYNSVLANNSLSENEIMKLENGINDTTVSDNIDENYVVANVDMILDGTHVENSNSINVINSYNMVIEWEEEFYVPNNEIF